MSIEFALCCVDGNDPQQLLLTGTHQESQLHDWLIKGLSIVAPESLLFGKEVHAVDSKRIDLPAIDRGGNLMCLS